MRYDEVDDPEPGMRYIDRLGPWFDDTGEVWPVGTDAVGRVVDLLDGTYQVRSNDGLLDARTLTVTLPDITALVQAEWDRIIAPPPGTEIAGSFLLNFESISPTTGRIAEELLVRLWIERHAGDRWPYARAFPVEEARLEGLIALPEQGERCDDLVMATPHGLVLVEAKCSTGTWSPLARMGRKGLRQLRATAATNVGAIVSGVLVCISLAGRQVGALVLDVDDLLADPTRVWSTVFKDWRPRGPMG